MKIEPWALSPPPGSYALVLEHPRWTARKLSEIKRDSVFMLIQGCGKILDGQVWIAEEPSERKSSGKYLIRTRLLPFSKREAEEYFFSCTKAKQDPIKKFREIVDDNRKRTNR